MNMLQNQRLQTGCLLLRYFLIYLKEREKDPYNPLSTETIRNIEQTVFWLRRYEKATKGLTFSDINLIFYRTFKVFLNENHVSDSTFYKHIKNLKTFMTWAKDNGLHNNKQYKVLIVKKTQADDQALTSEELTKVYTAQFSMKTVIDMIEKRDRVRLRGLTKQKRFKSFLRHRDMFVAMCSSGMYINDLINFSKNDIIDNSFVKYIRYKQSGEKESECIFDFEADPVFKFKELCEKYDYSFSVKKRSIYSDIKVMCEYLEINKTISPKSGRKTCASIWYYEREAPIYLVMNLLGHSKEESTKHYLRVEEVDILSKFRQLKKKGMIKAKGQKKTYRRAV